MKPPSAPTIPQTGPTEFLAELPADMGNLTLENSKPQQPPSNAPAQNPHYQAYQPSPTGQNNSPGQKYTLPRRAVSTSSLPLADPWRVADPVSELPTREFYIIADLLFDAIDRKFEPQNTGLLEASKILQSWRLQGLPEGVAEIFEYNSYTAFTRTWTKKSIPHVLVPTTPTLMPSWNFQAQTQADEMRIPLEPPADNTPYPTYFPALNRAGWYKFLFLDLVAQPESLEKLLSTLCGDTYKPGVLNQPDLAKRDRAPVPALTARAKLIQDHANRVAEEIAAEIQNQKTQVQGGNLPSPQGVVAAGSPAPQQQQQPNQTEAQLAAQMAAQLKMQQQMMQNMYQPNYGGFV